MNKTIIYFFLVFIIIFGMPFITKEFVTGFQRQGGGWTVALMKIKNDSNFMKSVNTKLSHEDFLFIPNNSTEYGDSIEFNADPFVFENNGVMYLFVETKPNGKRAHLSVYLLDSSHLRFHYLGVALKEPFHLSYPALYNIDGVIMLIPEMQRSGESWAYVADSFPFKWRKKYKISDQAIKDPTLLNSMCNKGYLYYSKKNVLSRRSFSFDSSIGFDIGREYFVKTGTTSRPGGAPFVFKRDTLLFFQNNRKGYGSGLVSYNVRSKEEKHFLSAQTKIPAFSAGMHHFSSIGIGDSLLVAMDGNFLVCDKERFSFNTFIKLNYLQIWSFWLPSIKPVYPFNF
jgi:hypothetical protein